MLRLCRPSPLLSSSASRACLQAAPRIGLGLASPAAGRFYTLFHASNKHIQPSSLRPSSGNPVVRKYSTSNSGASAPPKISAFQRIKLAASFSFYSVVVLAGVGVLGLVIYYFVSEVLLPTSDVQLFNKTVSILKKDPECQRILGTKLVAHGEASGNKWSRTRPVASRRGFDGYGREHLWMQFHIEGERIADIENGALARMEMIRDPRGSNKFEYRYLVLEVPGQPRVHLIDNTVAPHVRDKNVGFLGVKWGKKDE